jgi:superkiller protein 3
MSLRPYASVPSACGDQSLAVLIERLTARWQAGEPLQLSEVQRQHPEHAEQLAEVWPALEALAELERSQHEGAGSDGEGAEFLGELGDFRIVREVGRGGMGIVYEAEQISLGRRVALKVLPFAATMDPRHLQRFHNEARAAACLHHPHIVPVHFVGCERGVHFYAMQLIDGRSLAALLADLRKAAQLGAEAEAGDEQRTTLYALAVVSTARLASVSTERTAQGREYYRRVAELGVQAAQALDYAHERGVIHRDVKPANLLLDGHGDLWITDFGLAHLQNAEASLTMSGDLVGTLRYMSPEQALAQRVVIDHRTDVYSLGATLYELLTLEPAFTGSDRQELLRQIAFEEPLAPRKRERSIPAELETIVLKAVEKNPADRYATAQELADDLERFLKDEPIRARRPRLLQRGRKWARRHRPLVWSAAVCSLVALTLTGASLGFLAGERAERRGKAAEALDEAGQALAEGNEPGARTAAERAAGLLTGGGDPRLQQRLQQVKADLFMLAKLEFARLQQAEVKDGRFDSERADPLYAEAFRQYNLPVLELEPAEAARRIADSAIREQLLAALVNWADVHPDLARSNQLVALVRLADDDPWRTQVLFPALDKKDWPRIARLARQPEALNQPPARLVLLAGILARTDRPAAVKFLRRAQQRHPDDFWINHSLAWHLKRMEPPHLEEAIGFYRVAVALRPHSPGALYNLAQALRAQGQLADAEIQYREAIRLKPDYAEAHNQLGSLLCDDKRDYDGALAAFRAVLRLKPDDAKYLTNLGNALRGKGKVDEAIKCSKRAIALDPRYAPAHIGLGSALMDKGEVEGAIACYKKAIALDPKYATAHHNLGNALGDKGKVEEAIACYRRVIVLDPKYARAHNNLGTALHGKGQVDEAIACYRQAIALDPKHAPAHGNLGSALAAKGKMDEAIACHRKAIEIDPKDAKVHYNLGNALYAKRKVDEAIASYRKAIDIDPKDAAAHNNLGTALADKGKVEEAIACYRQAIALDPKYAQAHTNLGIALHTREKVEEAIACFRQALDIDPKKAEAHNNLGAALLDKGKVGEAIACFRKAIALDPKYAQGHTNLGLALKDKGQVDEAIACWRQAITLDPKDARPHYNLGIALKAKGKVEKAIASYREALALDPKDAKAHYNLGIALADKGKEDEAIACFRQAIRLKKAYAQAHYSLGLALHDKGKVDEAIACYRQALCLKNDLAFAHNNLGNALAGKGKVEEAIACYKKAIALDPRFALAHNNLGSALAAKGKMEEAIACYKKAIALDPRLALAHNNLRRALRVKGVLDKLPSILKGESRPADAAEGLLLAALCQQPFQRRYAASAGFYREAFTADPKLAENLDASLRYNAACAAALAGCGKGEDADKLDDRERNRLRRQALDWLRADLDAWRRLLERHPDKVRPVLIQTMQHWQSDADFAGLRGPQALARLPDAEWLAWQNLWADVAATLTRAQPNARWPCW